MCRGTFTYTGTLPTTDIDANRITTDHRYHRLFQFYNMVIDYITVIHYAVFVLCNNNCVRIIINIIIKVPINYNIYNTRRALLL